MCIRDRVDVDHWHIRVWASHSTFNFFCSKPIESVRMMARVVQLLWTTLPPPLSTHSTWRSLHCFRPSPAYTMEHSSKHTELSALLWREKEELRRRTVTISVWEKKKGEEDALWQFCGSQWQIIARETRVIFILCPVALIGLPIPSRGLRPDNIVLAVTGQDDHNVLRCRADILGTNSRLGVDNQLFISLPTVSKESV